MSELSNVQAKLKSLRHDIRGLEQLLSLAIELNRPTIPFQQKLELLYIAEKKLMAERDQYYIQNGIIL